MDSKEENIHLCQILKQEAEKRTGYRRAAYERAHDICMEYPEKITSGTQLRSIKGIGPKIEAFINQIVTEELPSENTSSERISFFAQLDGVGPETAKKWVEKGYTTLEDIPRNTLTEKQKIAVDLYPETSQRIPREEIELFEATLERWLKRDLKKHKTQFIIAGSYRRGKETSGDIDVLVLSDTFDLILECPLFTHTLAKGDRKWRGIAKINEIHRRVDLELTTPEQLPFALLYFTGSKEHNIWVRTEAKRKGYKLNEQGLFKDDIPVPNLKTEEDVYDFLGLEYFDPVDRN